MIVGYSDLGELATLTRAAAHSIMVAVMPAVAEYMQKYRALPGDAAFRAMVDAHWRRTGSSPEAFAPEARERYVYVPLREAAQTTLDLMLGNPSEGAQAFNRLLAWGERLERQGERLERQGSAAVVPPTAGGGSLPAAPVSAPAKPKKKKAKKKPWYKSGWFYGAMAAGGLVLLGLRLRQAGRR